MDKSTKNKSVMLPVREPRFSSYHADMIPCIVTISNPAINNWFLNNCIQLQCEKHFLKGLTTPHFCIRPDIILMPHYECMETNMRFVKSAVHTLIKNMLEEGYYVQINGIDDYYVEGKSRYREFHNTHDCLICGYDDEDNTYSLMAYNQKWVCTLFKTPQKCIEEGIQANFGKIQEEILIRALKVKPDTVLLDTNQIKDEIKKYLTLTIEKFPVDSEESMVQGTAVHNYLGMYLERIYYGHIMYERMDWRVFRVLWEHKKCMTERIRAVEANKNLYTNIADKYYKEVETESNAMRIMYAKHAMKRNDNLLMLIKHKLLEIQKQETEILKEFLIKIEEADINALGNMGSVK